jgi:cell division septation protein DedD
MAGQARAPGTAPVDVDKTAAAKSVAPEAPPAPAKEPTKALPKTPAEKAEPKAPEPKKAEPKTPLPSRFTANGAFLAQLGAFSSPAGARDAANALRARAASAVAGAAFDVQRAELDDGIVVHRLRVGGFADRPAVERFCQEMRAMGQGCMAVSR